MLAFYEQELKGSGWEVTTNSSDVGGTSNGSIEAKQEDGAKSLNLVISKNGARAGAGDGDLHRDRRLASSSKQALPHACLSAYYFESSQSQK